MSATIPPLARRSVLALAAAASAVSVLPGQLAMKALLAAADLTILSGAALADPQCRIEVFDVIGGRAAKLVPIGPNARCGTQGRNLSSRSHPSRLVTSELRTNQWRNRVPWDPSPNR